MDAVSRASASPGLAAGPARAGSEHTATPRGAGAARRILGGLASLREFVEGVLGADKYRGYLAHHARTHPGEPPMTEREFWRDYADWQDRNPQGRCC